MIKRLPGWLNFILLALAYYVGLSLLDLVFPNWKIGSPIRVVHVLAFCGAYLAKWRFFDGSWHFQ